MSGGLSLAIALTLVSGASGALAADPRAVAAGAADGASVESARDIATARVAARKAGHRVEAVSERSETSTTWVNADGSLTTELAAGPVRFVRDGRWVDVDIELRTGPDGSVAPKAHPAGLKLAAGSGGARAKRSAPARSDAAEARSLVTLGAGEEQVELQWKGGLPEPVVHGTRAVYRDAVGDGSADLVVEATRTGFEQFTVLRQRPAAGGYSYTMPLKAKGLKAQQQPDGSVLFTDRGTGRKRAVLPAPVMWDSTAVEGSRERPHRAAVDLKVVQRGEDVDLVFTPDAAFLTDPATVYPVTVDPSTSALGNAFDTRVQKGETVDWSADTELYWGNPGTKNADGSSREARAFINWNTAPIADSLVTGASLSLYNFHSGNSDCQPYTWEVWDTGLASTASRWTAQPAWNARKATSTETKGRDACGGDGWITADVTGLVQSWASAKNQVSGMGLRAPDEASTKYWKEVNSAEAARNVPKLSVTYNYRPRTGTAQQAGPPFTQDSTGTWRVDTTTPTLRDTFADQDGDKVNGTFQVFDASTNTQVGNVLVSPYAAAGTPASVTVPPGMLQHGRTYRFRTSPYDGTHYNLGWSPWATFTVSPLPDAPRAPQAGATETLAPILSGVVSNPAQGRVSAEFSLRNPDGSAVPNLTLPPVWTDSGRRAAVQLPDGVLSDGRSYRWSMRACTTVGCSAWTADQDLTVRRRPPVTPPTPVSVVIADAGLKSASVATDCATAPCPAAPNPAELPVGTGGSTGSTGPTGSSEWTTWLKADLSAIPTGARITRARLALTRTDCTNCATEQPLEVHALGQAWEPGRSGTDLTAASGSTGYATATPAELDLVPLVQSWLERGDNHGLALRLPPGAGASFASGTADDAAKRPRLLVEHVPPTAPGAPEAVTLTNGDQGLLAVWNPPADLGAAGEDPGYTVRVEDLGGGLAAQVDTGQTRAVVAGLDNSRQYRVVVAARNSVGTGPTAASAFLRGAAANGGAAQYQAYAQEYLEARGRILDGTAPTAADAAAEAPHGEVFRELLETQEAALVTSREALARHGQTYGAGRPAMSEVLVEQPAADRAAVRATVVDAATLRTTTGDDPTSGRGHKRFDFTIAAGAVRLVAEVDDGATGQTLSPTAAAQNQVELTDPTTAPAEDDKGTVPLDEDGFPVEKPPTAAQATYAGYYGSGTANWASRNINTRWEYGQDCTNFVSKALYYGGGMQFRWGGRTTDRAWWQQYYFFGTIKNKSYTWAGAENLRRHLIHYRGVQWVTNPSAARPGDIVFFKWRRESVYNHASVVVSGGRQVHLRQHGLKNETTLSDVLARNSGGSNPIDRVLILRPLGTG